MATCLQGNPISGPSHAAGKATGAAPQRPHNPARHSTTQNRRSATDLIRAGPARRCPPACQQPGRPHLTQKEHMPAKRRTTLVPNRSTARSPRHPTQKSPDHARSATTGICLPRRRARIGRRVAAPRHAPPRCAPYPCDRPDPIMPDHQAAASEQKQPDRLQNVQHLPAPRCRCHRMSGSLARAVGHGPANARGRPGLPRPPRAAGRRVQGARGSGWRMPLASRSLARAVRSRTVRVPTRSARTSPMASSSLAGSSNGMSAWIW
jgi:hypothetical protein